MAPLREVFSDLGPVLFNIYVNDIPKVRRALIAQYADDTATYFRARDLPTFQAELQRSLADAIMHFFHRWRIKINVKKKQQNKTKPICSHTGSRVPHGLTPPQIKHQRPATGLEESRYR